MISSIIKLSVSDFVFQILQNDAERFGFLKKEKEPNLNGLLNKLLRDAANMSEEDWKPSSEE